MSDTLSKAELHAQKACELEAFKSIKLDALKDKVTQMLAHIGDGRIFDQYTINLFRFLFQAVFPKRHR